MAELSIKALSELLSNPELVEVIAEPCACGATRVLSLGLSAVVCTDKYCPFRVAARLFAIAEKYHLDNAITLSDFEYLSQDRYYRTWLDFFTDVWEDTEFEETHKKLVAAIKADLDVTTLAVLSGFDCLSLDQLYNLCGDFQSVSDLASVLDNDGLVFIAERLGLTAAHLLPVAIHLYNSLVASVPEMLEAEDIF